MPQGKKLSEGSVINYGPEEDKEEFLWGKIITDEVHIDKLEK